MKLAYQDMSLQRKKQEEKIKATDPKKAEQLERLGMGFISNKLVPFCHSLSLSSSLSHTHTHKPPPPVPSWDQWVWHSIAYFNHFVSS